MPEGRSRGRRGHGGGDRSGGRRRHHNAPAETRPPFPVEGLPADDAVDMIDLPDTEEGESAGRDAEGSVDLNSLYKMTQMQTTFGIILLAIVDNQPKVMTLKELLYHFLNHRKTVIIRRTRYDLRKTEERAHILEGILKALDHLDEVIATIRSSRDPGDARERLMVGFALSDVQAQAILDMRLQRLTGLEREKVVEEYRELMATIERLRAILGSDRLVLEEIKKELLRLKELYGGAASIYIDALLPRGVVCRMRLPFRAMGRADPEAASAEAAA